MSVLKLNVTLTSKENTLYILNYKAYIWYRPVKTNFHLIDILQNTLYFLEDTVYIYLYEMFSPFPYIFALKMYKGWVTFYRFFWVVIRLESVSKRSQIDV